MISETELADRNARSVRGLFHHTLHGIAIRIAELRLKPKHMFPEASMKEEWKRTLRRHLKRASPKHTQLAVIVAA